MLLATVNIKQYAYITTYVKCITLFACNLEYVYRNFDRSIQTWVWSKSMSMKLRSVVFDDQGLHLTVSNQYMHGSGLARYISPIYFIHILDIFDFYRVFKYIF